MNNNEITKCVNCKNTNLKKFKDKFYCSECSSNFYVIEGVVFALNNTYDFFNINKKIKRFLEFKRDEKN